MKQLSIEVQQPRVERLHVGQFEFIDTEGEQCIGKFHVYVPPIDPHNPGESGTWRESAHTAQLNVAWHRLINAGFKAVTYKSLVPHPIFSGEYPRV
jgi:hypothetical protein